MPHSNGRFSSFIAAYPGRAIVYEYRCGAGEHIVGVEQLRRSRQRHGTDHGPELGDGQLHPPLSIDERRC
jgi:hypothetical protein